MAQKYKVVGSICDTIVSVPAPKDVAERMKKVTEQKVRSMKGISGSVKIKKA